MSRTALILLQGPAQVHKMSRWELRLCLRDDQEDDSERGVSSSLGISAVNCKLWSDCYISYLRRLEAKVQLYEGSFFSRVSPATSAQLTLLDTYPHLRRAVAHPAASVRGPPDGDEEDELEEELLLPEAFTQLSVESPTNTTTGKAQPEHLSFFFSKTLTEFLP